MVRHCILFLTIFVVCGLIGCGNTGELYLPDDTPVTENTYTK